MKLLRFALKFILCCVYVFQLSYFVKPQSDFDLTKPLSKCREVSLSNFSDYQIASDNEQNIYFFNKGGSIRQIDTTDGKENWTFNFGGNLNENFLIVEKKIYILVTNEINNTTKLRAINTDNGIVEWEDELALKSASTLTSDNKFIIITNSEGQIAAIDIASKKEIWSKKVSEELNTKPTIFGDRLFLSLKNTILQISLTDGNNLKKFSVKNKISAFFHKDNVLFLGTDKGIIYSINTETGEKNWEYRTGGKISSITGTNKGILFSSFDNYVYLFEEDGSQIVWKNRMATRNISDPLIFENLIVITNFGTNILDIFYLNNGRLVNRILIEQNNQFLDKPITSGNFLVVPTLKGIYFFGSNGC